MTRAVACLLLSCVLSVICQAAKNPLTSVSTEYAAQRMAEVPLLRDVRLSPDGAWVVYEVTRRSVATNELFTQHLLQRVPRDAEAAAEPVSLPEGASGVQWCPNSRCLSMILRGLAEGTVGDAEGKTTDAAGAPRARGFVRYDISTGAVTPIPVHGTAAISENYKWSPRGNYVAFAAPLAERMPLDPRRGVAHGLIEPGEPMALFVLDVRTGMVTQLTRDSMNVARSPDGNFDWAPDEQALVVAVDSQLQSWGFDTDLVVIDLASRRARPLVTQPGMDGRPCWSPDGRWMAFTRESLTVPAELFAVALDVEGRAVGTPRQLTQLLPDFEIGGLVHTEELSWPSPDGKFTIHGLLLTPASARTDGSVRQPLPTLLYFIGGSSMVRRGFAQDGWNGAYLSLVSRGYAVLMANTRGRGGYGLSSGMLSGPARTARATHSPMRWRGSIG